jgi:hypothetical protein
MPMAFLEGVRKEKGERKRLSLLAHLEQKAHVAGSASF